ncbi:unnamed protein product [Arabidopsis lyrata]|nr:unnamed protein product [Arabidopsis lyrata]
MFRKILKLLHKAVSFLKITISNGEETFFWWDPWTPFGPLIHFFGPDGPSNLGIPLFSLVKDTLSSTGWSLPPARSDLQLQLLAYITTISLSAANDVPIFWQVGDRVCRLFSSRDIWNNMRLVKPLVSWFPLVWHKAAIPKHSTTAWLFTLDRNPTLLRLASWGLDVESTCLLCGLGDESRNHLFFDCIFSQEIWNGVTLRLHLFNAPSSWQQVLSWLPNASSSRHISLALLQGWQACIYEIWKERNRRFHDGVTQPPHRLLVRILAVVKNKSTALHNSGSHLGASLLRIWSLG